MEGKEFIQRATSPLVGVLADETSLKPILAKNGLQTVSELLLPFGLRHHPHMAAMDIQGNPVTLESCSVRFAELQTMDHPIDAATLMSVMMTDVMPSFQHQTLPILRTVTDVASLKESTGFGNLTPWFRQCRDLLSGSYIGPSEHETFNHPVAMLVVVTTADTDPIATAKRLMAADVAILQKPFIDPSIHKLCLLVHDPQEAPTAAVNDTLEAMKKQFPAHAVTINTLSASAASSGTVSDIWTPQIVLTEAISRKTRSNATNNEVKGSLISVTDFAAIDGCVKDFVLKHVLEEMSRSVREWEREVASARRGISGRLFKVGLKYFGGSKAAAIQPASFTDKASGATVFPYTSPEMVMRRLADYSFMLKDYKYAQTIYESVKKDFSSSDKFAKFYAGVQEMLAITALMLSESPKGVETLLETAVQLYNDAKAPIYAFRSALWIIEMVKEHMYYKDAATLYVRMTGDDDLKSALFMEQAAICFLRGTPPMPRKYTFHLILAGHRYSKCGLRSHAQRNYLTGLETFENQNWTLIHDHINFALGRHYFQLNDMGSAVNHFLRLLHKSRQAVSVQRAYLAEFLFIYQQYISTLTSDTKKNVPSIPLPLIADSSIAVSTQGSLSSQQKAKTALSPEDEAQWASMETDLLEHINNAERPGNKKKTQVSPAQGQPSISTTQTTCAVGEPIWISFKWYNPLQVPIPANNVYLECVFGDQESQDTDKPMEDLSSTSNRIECADFDLEVLPDVSLDASEKRLVQLKVYPKREGKIRILGARYLLCGVIPSYKEFKKHGRRLNDTNAQRQDLKGVYEDDVSLSVLVTSPMPVLDAFVHSFPESLIAGEVRQVSLELHNKGTKALNNLFVKSNHGNIFYFGDGTAIETPQYSPKIGSTGSSFEESFSVCNKLVEESIWRLRLPKDSAAQDAKEVERLPASETTLVPVWIHADKPGRYTLKLLFAYQSHDTRGGYRTFRYTITLQVYPSIKVNTFTRTSLNKLDEFILGVEVENMHPSYPISVRQISSVSATWEFERLNANEGLDEVLIELTPNQNVYQYYQVKRFQQRETQKVNETPEMRTTAAIERLVMMEDAVSFEPPDIKLCVRNLARPGELSSLIPFPTCAMVQQHRYHSRVHSLASQYPGLTLAQLKQMFTLYLTDDMDLVFFWESQSTQSSEVIRGHVCVTGVNLSLYAPLPLSAWFSNLDAKMLAGRSLFSATVRERKALIHSLIKKKSKELSPVRVLVQAKADVEIDVDSECVLPVTVIIGNTSWMHVAEFVFEVVSNVSQEESSNGTAIGNGTTDTKGSSNASQTPVPQFSWIGQTSFKGKLKPLESTQFTAYAYLQTGGVMYDVNRWKLNVTLYFSDQVLDRKSSLHEAVGKKPEVTFVQIPTMPQHVLVARK